MTRGLATICVVSASLFATSPSASALREPTPAEAAFTVKTASCEDGTAVAKIRTMVRDLPTQDFYYLIGRTRLEVRQSDGGWRPAVKRFAISHGFSADDLPERWNMRHEAVVPEGDLGRRLRVHYRIELLTEDDNIWRASGDSQGFTCDPR